MGWLFDFGNDGGQPAACLARMAAVKCEQVRLGQLVVVGWLRGNVRLGGGNFFGFGG